MLQKIKQVCKDNYQILAGAAAGAALLLPGLASAAGTMSGFTLDASVTNDTVTTASSQLFPVIVGLIASTASLLIILAAIKYGVRFIRWIAHKLIGVSR